MPSDQAITTASRLPGDTPGVYVPVMTAFWSEVVEPAGQSPVGQSHQAPSLTFPIAPQASAMSLRLRRALPPRRAIVLFRGTQDGRVLAYDFKTGKPARWIEFSWLAFLPGALGTSRAGLMWTCIGHFGPVQQEPRPFLPGSRLIFGSIGSFFGFP